MEQTIPTLFYQVIKIVTYFAFLCLGFYFIFKGDILQKFSAGKTSVSYYSEPITELPTMITFPDLAEEDPKRGLLKLGKDFHIALGSVESHWEYIGELTNLTLGENKLDSGLKVNLDIIFPGIYPKYKITPINFSPGMPVSLCLKYYLEPTANSVSHIRVQITSENNSVSVDGRYYDGDWNALRMRRGEKDDVTVTPKKEILLPDEKGCRNTPYNELLLQRASDLNIDHSSCWPHDIANMGKRLNRITQHLPNCKSEAEVERLIKKLLKGLPEKEMVKPCTKLSYKTETNTYRGDNQNQVKCKFMFAQPSKVQVKEEYVIFDTITFISSVGGTLGLCIGFSFYTLTGALIDWSEIGFGQLSWRHLNKQLQKERNKVEVAPVGSPTFYSIEMTKELIKNIIQDEEFEKKLKELTKNNLRDLTKM